MENPEQKKFPWVSVILVVIIILAGIQFAQNRSNSVANKPIINDSSTQQIENSEASTQSVAAAESQNINKTNTTNKNFMNIVTLETNKGTIIFETYNADAPKATENFINLAKKGFYNNLIFHRVISGFMIQGGDPTGTGTGGPGYKFADELDPNTVSSKTGYVRGTVAMANSGPNTNGSQFFIMHKDTPLPHLYTIFGKVIAGMDVVDAIAATPVGSGDKPVTDVVIKKVTIAEK